MAQAAVKKDSPKNKPQKPEVSAEPVQIEDSEEIYSYDLVPYESYSYPHTQPPSLHFVGSLFKMNPPDIEKARVLELGCASGGNILPMAAQFPKAKFHAIDLAKVQIDEANRQKDALGLDNITFEQMDIMDFPEDAGEYDYIMCHGILSWVPDFVSEKIMEIFGKHLAQNGLALVSYNCLPGWHFVRALREMMQFHAKRFKTPQEQLAQAKAFLDFVHDNVSAGQDSYKQTIDKERNTLKHANDSYFFHDHLEDENRQFYLHEVNDMAVKNDLAYVGDTSIQSMFVGNVSKEAKEKLGGIGDIILQEQYMDFLNNRRFRNSIFTRQGNTITRNINLQDYINFYIKPNFKPVEEDAGLQQEMQYKANTEDMTFKINSKELNAFMLTAIKHAQNPLKGQRLLKEAEKEYKVDPEKLKAEVTKNFFQLYFSGFFTLSSYQFKKVKTVSKKPEVFAYTRLQAATPGISKVCTIAGNNVPTDKNAALMLREADGTKTLDEISEIFIKQMKESNENLQVGGKTVTDEKEVQKLIRKLVEDTFERFAQNDLLVG